jgi:hypothetical protein
MSERHCEILLEFVRFLSGDIWREQEFATLRKDVFFCIQDFTRSP